MKEIKLDKDTFLIKIVDGKIKIHNPHGEESKGEYEELKKRLGSRVVYLPKQDADKK